MASCSAEDNKTSQRPARLSTRHGIGEIPFFLDVPANLEPGDAEERERAIAEMENDRKP